MQKDPLYWYILHAGSWIRYAGMSLNISYFVNLYPATTHTFIRREISGLESLGHSVQRLSMRRGTDLVDEHDLDELSKTVVFVENSKVTWLISIVSNACARPARFLSAIWFAAGYCLKRGIAPHRMFAYLAQAALIYANCKKHQAHHLRVHLGGNAAVIARLAHRMGGPPFSIAYHGPDEFDAAQRWDITGAVHESSFVTAISFDCKAKICRWAAPSDWNRVHVLRCAVAEEFMRNEPIPIGAQTRICVISRLEAPKGLPLLLDALAQLSARTKLPHIDIVGDGSMKEYLAARVSCLDLDDRVHFHGTNSGDDVRRMISSASAILLPSLREGLPVVLMEAMALGRPVIASWCDGIPELVRAGIDGWTFAPGDLSGLTSSLEQFLQARREDLSAMGSAGHKQVSRLHHPQALANQLDRILRNQIDSVANLNHFLHKTGVALPEMGCRQDSGVLRID